MIIKAWSPDVKYWSASILSRLGRHIGKPINNDKAIRNKDKIHFAKLLIEVRIGDKLLDVVDFVNEQGILMQQEVIYGWRPVKCIYYNFFGHNANECRKKQGVTRVWRPVQRYLKKSRDRIGMDLCKLQLNE